MLARERDARLQLQPRRSKWWVVGAGFVLGMMVGGTLVGLRACRDTAQRPVIQHLPGPPIHRR